MIPIGSIIGFTYTRTREPFYVIAKLVNYILPKTSACKFISIYSYEGFAVGTYVIFIPDDIVILCDNETEFLDANPEYAL